MRYLIHLQISFAGVVRKHGPAFLLPSTGQNRLMK
jgi:hypothetical protein